jgi:hypothetical protein
MNHTSDILCIPELTSERLPCCSTNLSFITIHLFCHCVQGHAFRLSFLHHFLYGILMHMAKALMPQIKSRSARSFGSHFLVDHIC